jgi:16S rRNA processing protein RimM
MVSAGGGGSGGEMRAAMVCVAQVATAHGVRGALKLRCFTEAPDGAAAYGPLCDERGRELFSVRVVGRAPGGVIAEVEGIRDRDAALALRGTRLYVPRERLPEPEEGEFYHEDLVGLAARTPEGEPLGRVTAVHDFGAGELLEVELASGGSELVPFTHEAVPDIDLAGGHVTVVLPEAPR